MILFIDDEPRYMDSYIRELELSKYEVVFQHNVDEALKFFEDNLTRINLIILDIMMPPGSSFKDVDTQLGLRTGVYFYERVRQTAPELSIIILTNVSDIQLANQFKREKNCWLLRKEEYLPFELTEYVETILTENRQ